MKVGCFLMLCYVQCSSKFKFIGVCTLKIWAAEKNRRTRKFCIISGRVTFSVFFTIYGAREMVKLLVLYYLLLLLRLWQLKDQKVFHRNGSRSLPKRFLYLVCTICREGYLLRRADSWSICSSDDMHSGRSYWQRGIP